MKNILLFAIVFASMSFRLAVDEPVLVSDDINILMGEKWKGNLIYLDYQSKKQVSIPVELVVSKIDEEGKYLFSYEFTKEPDANSLDTVIISDSGRKFDNETMVEKNSTGEGSLQFVTESRGMDDDKPATFHHTYTLSSKKFTIRKDVKFDDSDTFFIRNEFVFER